jgi:predicted TIM-barrel fold metal-dependent hydrolase
MAAAVTVIRNHPTLTVILNHVGCPINRDDAGYADWLAGMQALGQLSNCFCKISGLIHPMHTDPGPSVVG